MRSPSIASIPDVRQMASPSRAIMDDTTALISKKKLNPKRFEQAIKVIDPGSDDDEDGPSLFIAQPTDDIPRNKLVEKLARGLQAFVQRMQKREAFYVTVVKIPIDGW